MMGSSLMLLQHYEEHSYAELLQEMSPGKEMDTVFCHVYRVLLVDFTPLSSKINAAA
jgi:hypothetical protein